MESSEAIMLEDLKEILRQGWLEKQSKYLQQWRKRWFVLTPQRLYTFQEQKQYNSPTQRVELRSVQTIKSSDDETHKENSFRIDGPDATYYMVAINNHDKEQWIGAIGKAMVKLNIMKKGDDDDD